MIEIHVNGEARQIESVATIASLLEQMGLAGKRIAIEHNREIVPRSAHAEVQLQAQDRLEIVHAIGGG